MTCFQQSDVKTNYQTISGILKHCACVIGDPDLDESDVFFSAEENEDIDILDDNFVSENDNFNIDNRRWWTGHGIPTWWQWGPPWNKGGSPVKVWPHPQESGRSFGESMESWFRLGISQRSAYIEINQIIDFLEYHESAEVTCEDLEELNDMERSLVKQWHQVLCLWEWQLATPGESSKKLPTEGCRRKKLPKFANILNGWSLIWFLIKLLPSPHYQM